MKTQSPHTVIIGGGMSGLTTAYWLRQSGTQVTVVEKEPSVGGTMKTSREDGWLIEMGPNSALETTPLFREMFADLGIEALYANPAANNRYIYRQGLLHALPLSPGAFFRSELFSRKGKLRLLKEPFIGRAQKEESVAEFVTRRLGREFLEYAINPFVAGVYAGNPEELSVREAFPKLYALEEKYRGLFLGMIRGARERRKRAETAKDRSRMFSFGGGMQVLPDAIAARLGESVRVNSTVSHVAGAPSSTGRRRRYQVTITRGRRKEKIEADAVVFSAPAFAIGPLVSPFSTELSATLGNIYYPPVAEIFLGFEGNQIPRVLDGFGYLIPACEHRRILGTIWSSAIFPHRAPDGHVALTTFAGGARQPGILKRTDDELIRIVCDEIREIMGLIGKPVVARVLRWERAIPQYNVGYAKVLSAIDHFEAENPGLYVCSNFRGGIAVGDCVKNGKITADRILAGLR